MDKIDDMLKLNNITNEVPDLATEILKDYIKIVKRQWINIILLLAMMLSICVGVLYFISNYDVVTTYDTITTGGDYQKYTDNATHNKVN